MGLKDVIGGPPPGCSCDPADEEAWCAADEAEWQQCLREMKSQADLDEVPF
jgi:hypothetical protein